MSYRVELFRPTESVRASPKWWQNFVVAIGADWQGLPDDLSQYGVRFECTRNSFGNPTVRYAVFESETDYLMFVLRWS